jgi:hypothetical protein
VKPLAESHEAQFAGCFGLAGVIEWTHAGATTKGRRVARYAGEELMARRASTSGRQRAAPPDSIFSLAERMLIGLYDAGVLSPAVLQHVLLGFIASDIDWDTVPTQRSTDGKSLHEIVAATMMPGRTTRGASKDFLSVINHLREHLSGTKPGTGPVPQESAEEDDDELLSQLGGATAQRNRPDRPPRSSRHSRPSAGFNPLFHAASPSRKSSK